jgi:hypothetical protein
LVNLGVIAYLTQLLDSGFFHAGMWCRIAENDHDDSPN